MNRSILRAIPSSLLLLASVVSPAVLARAGDPAPQQPGTNPAAPAPLVQIALLLDTSSSMEGLLQQAKTQLWKVVNEVATARIGGKAPALEVALYEYGDKTLPPSSGFLRRVAPLTDDLDRISDELSRLRILGRGCEEYCGRAIDAAVRELAWNGTRDALKVIFVAGNESFAQGDLDYRTACRDAIVKDIIVNTIFCGSREEGISLGWQDGAKRGEGEYSNIDQDLVPATLATPQDPEIIRLGEELNRTYVPYGAGGRDGLRRQEAQDRNAAKSETTAVERGISKGSDLYVNPEWDLVDAVRRGKVRIEDVKDTDLPEAMRGLDVEGRTRYLEAKARVREEIRARIAALGATREKEMAKRLAEQNASPRPPANAAAGEGKRTEGGARDAGQEGAAPGGKIAGGAAPGAVRPPAPAAAATPGEAARPAAQGTLDSAVIRALRRQAAAKGFSFGEKAGPGGATDPGSGAAPAAGR